MSTSTVLFALMALTATSSIALGQATGKSSYLTNLLAAQQLDPRVTWLSPDNEPPRVAPLANATDVENARRLSTTNGIDWRALRNLRPVGNQGTCGSCWAFSASHAMDDDLLAENREYNVDVNSGSRRWTSVQDVLECSTFDGAATCAGAALDSAALYFLNRGSVWDTCKPYIEGNDGVRNNVRCSTGCSTRGLSYSPGNRRLFRAFYANSVSAIKSALEVGPGAICMVFHPDFHNYVNYGTNVYHPTVGTDGSRHAMEIVGWGRANSRLTWTINGVTYQGQLASDDYWIVKNSVRAMSSPELWALEAQRTRLHPGCAIGALVGLG